MELGPVSNSEAAVVLTMAASGIQKPHRYVFRRTMYPHLIPVLHLSNGKKQ